MNSIHLSRSSQSNSVDQINQLWRVNLTEILRDVKILPKIKQRKSNGDIVDRNLDTFLPNIVHHGNRNIISNRYSENRDIKENIDMIENEIKESMITEIIDVFDQFKDDDSFLFEDEIKQSKIGFNLPSEVEKKITEFLNSLAKDYVFELLQEVSNLIMEFSIHYTLSNGPSDNDRDKINRYFENYLDLLEAKIGNLVVKYNKTFGQEREILEKIKLCIMQ